MFYSQDILQKRGGKFGIVWLAATRAGALSKKDYYSVHIVKSCDDVLQHVTLKATLHGVKQRFSLYLSSQLMYGITKVYGKQADYLLAEVQRLHRQFSSTRLLLATLADPDEIDHFQLPKAARSAAYCTLPQPDLNQDIFTSDWLMTLRVPPNIFEEEFISSSIMRGEPGMSFISPDRPISPLEELEDVWDKQHIVSDIGEITLREDEPIVPDIQIGELDDLGGLAPHGMEEALASIQYPEEEGLLMDGKGDADIDITAAGEGKVWTVEEETGKLVLSPITTRRRSKRLASSEGTAAEVVSTPVVASTKPLEKESSDEGVPEFKTPQSPSGKAVDIPILRLAAIHEEEGSTPVEVRKGRKRRRQLVFVDLKTQLSKNDMRSNMSDFENLIETDVLANPNPLPSAKDLFKEPARKAARMSSVLVDLWQEGASVSPRRETEEGDDRVWSTEYLRPSVPKTSSSSDEVSLESKLPEVPELGRGEFESPEHLREQASKADDSRASAAKMDDTPASLILTDISKLSESREGSRQGSFIAEPSLQRLRRPEESIEEEGLAAVQDIQMDGVVPHPDEFLIPEEPELIVHEQGMQSGDWDGKPAELSTSEDEEKGIPHENIYNQILELTSKQGSTSFQELVPFTTDRKIAAKIFAICLEYAKEKLIYFKQSRPYANILIYSA